MRNDNAAKRLAGVRGEILTLTLFSRPFPNVVAVHPTLSSKCILESLSLVVTQKCYGSAGSLHEGP